MALTVVMYKKDLLPTLEVDLKDANDDCLDLTTVQSVTFAMGESSSNLIINHKPCEIVDAVHGLVRYNWEAGDTDIVGEFLGEIVVTFQNGKPESGGLFTVSIQDSLRP